MPAADNLNATDGVNDHSFSNWIVSQDLDAEHTSLIHRIQPSRTVPLPSYDGERDNQCIAKWQWYFQQLDDQYFHTVVSIETWANYAKTLETIGEGTLATACDGIPRFKFGTASRTTLSSYLSVVNEWTQTTNYFTHSMQAASPHMTSWATTLELPAQPPQDSDCELGVQPEKPMEETPEHKQLCDDLFNSYYDVERNPFNQASTASEIVSLRRKCPGRSECALDVGDEVVLIYWPPESTTSRDICNLPDDKMTTAPITKTILTPRTLTTTAITFHGQDMLWDESSYG